MAHIVKHPDINNGLWTKVDVAGGLLYETSNYLTLEGISLEQCEIYAPTLPESNSFILLMNLSTMEEQLMYMFGHQIVAGGATVVTRGINVVNGLNWNLTLTRNILRIVRAISHGAAREWLSSHSLRPYSDFQGIARSAQRQALRNLDSAEDLMLRHEGVRELAGMFATEGTEEQPAVPTETPSEPFRQAVRSRSEGRTARQFTYGGLSASDIESILENRNQQWTWRRRNESS